MMIIIIITSKLVRQKCIRYPPKCTVSFLRVSNEKFSWGAPSQIPPLALHTSSILAPLSFNLAPPPKKKRKTYNRNYAYASRP